MRSLLRSLVVTTLVGAGALASAAVPTAGAVTPPTPVSFGCGAQTPSYGTVSLSQSLDLTVAAPLSVVVGSSFQSTIQSDPLVFPSSMVVSGQTVTINSVSDLTIRFQVPDNVSLDSFSLTPNPDPTAPPATLTQVGGALELHLAVPMAGGTTAPMPLVTMDLTATGAVSSKALTALLAGSDAYGYTTNVTVFGSTFDAVVTCTPGDPTLASTLLVAVGDPAPSATISGCTASEGGSCEFTVTLSWPRGTPMSVDFGTVDGTAVAGTRYTATSGTLDFAVGEDTKTISVPTLVRAGPYPDQTFSVQLTNPLGMSIATGTASGTVVDSSPPPYVIAARDDVHRTSASGTQTLHIPVNLQNRWGQNIAIGADVTVHWTTADFTAVAPDDYVAASGDLLFPAGSTASQFIDVTVPASAGPKGPTFFLVGLSSPSLGQVGGFGPGVGFGVIWDDPAP